MEPRPVVDSLQTAADHGAHARRDVDLVDVEILAPLAVGVEQPSFLVQVAEQFLDEERIPASLVEEFPDEQRRGIFAAQHGEQGADATLGQRLQPDQTHQALSGQRFECIREGVAPWRCFTRPAADPSQKTAERARQAARLFRRDVVLRRYAPIRITAIFSRCGARCCVSCSVDSSAHCRSSREKSRAA